MSWFRQTMFFGLSFIILVSINTAEHLGAVMDSAEKIVFGFAGIGFATTMILSVISDDSKEVR